MTFSIRRNFSVLIFIIFQVNKVEVWNMIFGNKRVLSTFAICTTAHLGEASHICWMGMTLDRGWLADVRSVLCLVVIGWRAPTSQCCSSTRHGPNFFSTPSNMPLISVQRLSSGIAPRRWQAISHFGALLGIGTQLEGNTNWDRA